MPQLRLHPSVFIRIDMRHRYEGARYEGASVVKLVSRHRYQGASVVKLVVQLVSSNDPRYEGAMPQLRLHPSVCIRQIRLRLD
jgi:hypothetical protein